MALALNTNMNMNWGVQVNTKVHLRRYGVGSQLFDVVLLKKNHILAGVIIIIIFIGGGGVGMGILLISIHNIFQVFFGSSYRF